MDNKIYFPQPSNDQSLFVRSGHGHRGLHFIRVMIIFMLIFSGVQQRLISQIDAGDYAPGTPPGIFVPGYVILSDGDTLVGEIKWALKYIENNPVEIKFKTESTDSRSFNAGEIKGFGIRRKVWEDDNPVPILLEPEHYVSLPSYKKGIPVFMSRLIDGRIKVYLNRQSIGAIFEKKEEDTRIDGIAFTYSSDEGLRIGLTYRTDYTIIERRIRYLSYFVSKENGAIIKVEKENYNELFTVLFGDCPQIDDEVRKDSNLLKFRNFMILVEVYNQLCPLQ